MAAEHVRLASNGARREFESLRNDLREALGPDDIVVSDVGAHKVWVARLFQAYEPNTVIISNGFAAMGISVPGAIAAKLVYPDRRVVALCGDMQRMPGLGKTPAFMKMDIDEQGRTMGLT